MAGKLVLALLVLVAAVNANPGAKGPWHWKPRHPTVTPNIRALPPQVVFQPSVPKQPRVPGTKAVAGCGVPVVQNDAKIVGGTEAVPHSFPWMAALFIDNMFFCGGSLISQDWVLTAAHCTEGAGFVDVVLGAHNLQLAEPTQVTIRSTTMIVHENWNRLTLANDISVINLPTPVTFDNFIIPICLPAFSDAQLADGTMVTPSGWGKTSDGIGGISDVLNEVTVPTMNNAVCNSFYTIVTDNIICIDTTGGMGTCNGDSGGPLNWQSGGTTYSRGITSFGASAGCEAGFPAGFTRTLNYVGWIETNTGIAIDP